MTGHWQYMADCFVGCLLSDGDMNGVLTPSQVSEIKKLLERQQQAALTASDGYGHISLFYLKQV